MYRAICIHCMSPMWFNPTRKWWTHHHGESSCKNGYTSALPIEMTITPKPELQGTYKAVTPGLVP